MFWKIKVYILSSLFILYCIIIGPLIKYVEHILYTTLLGLFLLEFFCSLLEWNPIKTENNSFKRRSWLDLPFFYTIFSEYTMLTMLNDADSFL